VNRRSVSGFRTLHLSHQTRFGRRLKKIALRLTLKNVPLCGHDSD
jgi:hypothetical protein